MDLTLLGNIILIICLVILGVALYYLIEKVSRTLQPSEDRCEVEHAAKKDRRCNDYVGWSTSKIEEYLERN